jgi:hypothetical protein
MIQKLFQEWASTGPTPNQGHHRCVVSPCLHTVVRACNTASCLDNVIGWLMYSPVLQCRSVVLRHAVSTALMLAAVFITQE